MYGIDGWWGVDGCCRWRGWRVQWVLPMQGWRVRWVLPMAGLGVLPMAGLEGSMGAVDGWAGGFDGGVGEGSESDRLGLELGT